MKDFSNMTNQQFGKSIFGLKKQEVYSFLSEAEIGFRELKAENESLDDQLEGLNKTNQDNQLKCVNLQKELDESKAELAKAEEKVKSLEAELAKAQAALKAAKAAPRPAPGAPRPQPGPGAPRPAAGARPKPGPGAPKPAPKPQPAPKPKPQPQPKVSPKPAASFEEDEDDDVFSGEVEDKVSNAFRIGNDDDPDEGFDFL